MALVSKILIRPTSYRRIISAHNIDTGLMAGWINELAYDLEVKDHAYCHLNN